MKLSSHCRRARRALHVLLSIAFFCHFSRSAAAQPIAYSVPSGQEEIVLDMLGRGLDLPDDCTLGGVSINRDVIVANYACGERRPVLELRHPQTQVDGLRTAQFVVTTTGDSVPTLLPSLAPVIERHEASFHWIATKPAGNTGSKRDPLSPAASNPSSGVSSGLLGLAVALALVGWAAWRERNRKRQRRT